jgi:hypothetical protein
VGADRVVGAVNRPMRQRYRALVSALFAVVLLEGAAFLASAENLFNTLCGALIVLTAWALVAGQDARREEERG